MTIRDTSLIALEQIKDRLGHDEQLVFEILLELGPCHDRRILEALNQKESTTPRRQRRKWEINSVTGRRNGLVAMGKVRDLGPYKGVWNGKVKTYHFWKVRSDDRAVPPGWSPAPKARRPGPRRSRIEADNHLQQIKRKAEAPVLARLLQGEQQLLFTT